MPSNPTVTVAIPVYNGAEFLSDALSSVLRQSYADFELLVCDDGSSDSSLQIAERIGDPRIRIDRHTRYGMSANWNRCLSLARGKYIKLMGQDDLLHPDCLARQLALMEESPNPVLAFCRREIIRDESDPRSVRWVELHGTLEGDLQPLSRVNRGGDLLARWSRNGFQRNCIGEPVTAMFHAGLARTLGGFSTELRQNMDYSFWIRLLPHGDVCFTPEALCSFRLHKNGTTYGHLGGRNLLLERMRLLDELQRDGTISRLRPELKRLKRIEFVKAARILTRRLLARDLSLEAMRRKAGDVGSFVRYCLRRSPSIARPL